MSSSFPRASGSMTVQITCKFSTPVLQVTSPRRPTGTLTSAYPPPIRPKLLMLLTSPPVVSQHSMFLVTQSWDHHQPPKSLSESLLFSSPTTVLPSAATVKNLPGGAGDARHVGSISGLGKSRWVGNGNPLECSHLGNPMDRGAR